MDYKKQYKKYSLLFLAIIIGTGSGNVSVAAQLAGASAADEVSFHIDEADINKGVSISADHATPSLVHLYRMHMYYTKAWFVELEAEHGTEGQFYGILEGSVKGENISGEFHIANFPRRRTDGNFLPDARGALETDDGAVIMLNLKGISHYSEDSASPQVLFGIQHYTNSDDYKWLNQTYSIAVGEMLPSEEGPTEFIYDIFQVKWKPRINLNNFGFNPHNSTVGNNSEEIKSSVLDYIEGLYDMNLARIERSVHPELSKNGLRLPGGESGYIPHAMSYDDLLNAAETSNIDGRIPDDAPKEIEILDNSGMIATVQLLSFWGVEYLHLIKYDDNWKIIHIAWQEKD